MASFGINGKFWVLKSRGDTKILSRTKSLDKLNSGDTDYTYIKERFRAGLKREYNHSDLGPRCLSSAARFHLPGEDEFRELIMSETRINTRSC